MPNAARVFHVLFTYSSNQIYCELLEYSSRVVSVHDVLEKQKRQNHIKTEISFCENQKDKRWALTVIFGSKYSERNRKDEYLTDS